MSEEVLSAHRQTWQDKPILRLLYANWYDQIKVNLVPGLTLEIGSGSGNLAEYTPDVICSDITHVPWIDVVADAQNLPFAEGSIDNIVLFDVLHHLENPVRFFDEAVRVLRPGGRIVLMEPYISALSWPVYHFLHEEPVVLNCDPLECVPHDPQRKPFDANQAIPTLMFARKKSIFEKRFPRLSLRSRKYLSFIAYPMSGGFDHRSLISVRVARWLLNFERFLSPLGRGLAFRMLVVLELRR
jgi:SAM-dependent methyltransferase